MSWETPEDMVHRELQEHERCPGIIADLQTQLVAALAQLREIAEGRSGNPVYAAQRFLEEGA